MFEHGGLRPLWPVVLFVPWFLVGFAYLVGWVRHPRSRMALSRRTWDPRLAITVPDELPRDGQKR